MSLRRRLDKLDARTSTRIPAWIRGLTDEQLTERLAAEAGRLHRYAPMQELGPPSPALAHLSDDELLARLEAARAAVAAQRGGTG